MKWDRFTGNKFYQPYLVTRTTASLPVLFSPSPNFSFLLSLLSADGSERRSMARRRRGRRLCASLESSEARSPLSLCLTTFHSGPWRRGGAWDAGGGGRPNAGKVATVADSQRSNEVNPSSQRRAMAWWQVAPLEPLRPAQIHGDGGTVRGPPPRSCPSWRRSTRYSVMEEQFFWPE